MSILRSSACGASAPWRVLAPEQTSWERFSSFATARLAVNLLLSDHLQNMDNAGGQRTNLCFIA